MKPEFLIESAEVGLCVTPEHPLSLIADFAPKVQAYVQASRAPNTLRGYRSDWAHFTEWCERHGSLTLPARPETVASYLSATAEAGLKAGTIQRRVASIAANHTANGFESPTKASLVRLTLAGIRRQLGTRQLGKEPTLTADIAAMTLGLPKTLIGRRNRALLLLGYAGALRRSELVSIDVEDLTFTADGIRLMISRSKTDQEGEGQVVGIAAGTALCPVRALREWLDASKISSGAVFRRISRFGTVGSGRLTDQVVATIVKAGAVRVGLDPKKYAGHSLRAGLVTQAALNDVPEHRIMRQTRHKSADMVRKYIRDVDLMRNSASAALGL